MKDLGIFELVALACAVVSSALLVWAEYGRRAAIAALAMGLGLVLLTLPGCGDDKPLDYCFNLRPASIGELCGFDVQGYPAVQCMGYVHNDDCLVKRYTEQDKSAWVDLYCVALCDWGGAK